MSERITETACSKCSIVAGFFPMTRRDESPRPMARSIRPPEMTFSVARRLAVTVGSRTIGLVTSVPSRIFRVSPAIRVSSGYGSCQSTCESNDQP